MRAMLATLFVASLPGIAGCGGGSNSNGGTVGGSNPSSLGPPTILRLVYDDGRGARQVARLTCTNDGADGTGYLRARAPESCKQIGSHKNLLTKRPANDRACTQIYGGPETLRVAGRVEFDTVERTSFARTNGCDISDWKRLAPLLPANAAGI